MQELTDMACLRVGVFPELHARATGVVESGVKRPPSVGLKGKGFGAGRVIKNGKLFFKGKDVSHELVRRAVVRTEVTSMALNLAGDKTKTGSGGAVLEDVPHLTDWLPDLPVRIFFALLIDRPPHFAEIRVCVNGKVYIAFRFSVYFWRSSNRAFGKNIMRETERGVMVSAVAVNSSASNSRFNMAYHVFLF